MEKENLVLCEPSECYIIMAVVGKYKYHIAAHNPGHPDIYESIVDAENDMELLQIAIYNHKFDPTINPMRMVRSIGPNHEYKHLRVIDGLFIKMM